MAKIFINQQSYPLTDKSNLQQVLENNGYLKPSGIAVAVNQQVIPKQKWTTFLLNNKDKILVITATQGG